MIFNNYECIIMKYTSKIHKTRIYVYQKNNTKSTKQNRYCNIYYKLDCCNMF